MSVAAASAVFAMFVVVLMATTMLIVFMVMFMTVAVLTVFMFMLMVMFMTTTMLAVLMMMFMMVVLMLKLLHLCFKGVALFHCCKNCDSVKLVPVCGNNLRILIMLTYKTYTFCKLVLGK